MGTPVTQRSQKSTFPHSVHLKDCEALTGLPQIGQWCSFVSLMSVAEGCVIWK
jgi:hypothetical protein